MNKSYCEFFKQKRKKYLLGDIINNIYYLHKVLFIQIIKMISKIAFSPCPLTFQL